LNPCVRSSARMFARCSRVICFAIEFSFGPLSSYFLSPSGDERVLLQRTSNDAKNLRSSLGVVDTVVDGTVHVVPGFVVKHLPVNAFVVSDYRLLFTLAGSVSTDHGGWNCFGGVGSAGMKELLFRRVSGGALILECPAKRIAATCGDEKSLSRRARVNGPRNLRRRRRRFDDQFSEPGIN
jgi:hypothetical protein